MGTLWERGRYACADFFLSKRQILEHVFDAEGEFVDENTIAVNIRRLWEKIEEQPAKPVYIKNIRWLGYVWDMRVSR